jgi:predicted nucleotidyltransferase
MQTLENRNMSRETALKQICQQYGIEIVYVFGSRAQEVLEWLHDEEAALAPGDSDVDIGVKPSEKLSVRQKAELAVAFENLFGVYRIDLASIPEVNPFLAANIIRGERLYNSDSYLADEYDLYILRRAGDLIPLERERQQLIMDSLK